MASGVVVRNDDESASLLDDDGSPVLLAGVSTPPPPPKLHGKATRTPRHAVMRLICSPFAAVLRMTTCADTDAISPSVEQPSKKTAAGAVVERREARRRPSLEQLIRMETAPLPLPPPSRPGRRRKPDTTSEVSIRTTAKEKHAQELFSPPKSLVVSVSDDERRAAAVPAVKSDADDRRTNAKRLVVVFESLRACSRAPGIGLGMPTKGLSRKVAGAGCAPGKAELFYCRPIPMGRRCRVQHLEESPYK
ncbi:hypothetical protein SETIT_5G042700v2 [Setaria italica]|uniref:Uncharacterized protein n=1 Tax=Setaria italica TaxID=4555 RepID=K3XLB3_SETIT|nr:uncharacterized protein LOC101780149 [Setaria italica]RCV23909.1 hypothetical protein SETIT_5G042700v2 [Setaria italica]